MKTESRDKTFFGFESKTDPRTVGILLSRSHACWTGNGQQQTYKFLQVAGALWFPGVPSKKPGGPQKECQNKHFIRFIATVFALSSCTSFAGCADTVSPGQHL